MKTKSIKTYAGLDPERAEQSAFLSPNAFIEALETLQEMGLPEWVTPDEARQAAILDQRGKDALFASFGKWLPKGFDRLNDAALAELEAAAEERGWPVTAEEVLASKVSVIQRLKELDAWTAEKRSELRAKHWEAFYRQVGRKDGKPVYRRFYTRHEREDTVKQMVDGKFKWVDATVYELPPQLIEEVQIGKRRKWLKSETKTGSLEKSRYLFKMPDGTVIDLGKTQGRFKPCKRNGPDAAMQSIAKRLGRNIRGGATTILQTLLGRTDILPAYTTVWFNEGWLTFIGWQKDPKLSAASYVETLDGKLLKTSKERGERLSVSKAEYAIISKPSIRQDDTEGDEADGYLELDGEFIEQGFARDREREVHNSNDFIDGMVLLEQIAAHMGLRNEFLSGDAVWLRSDFEAATTELVSQMQRERRPLCRALRRLRREYREMNAILKEAPVGIDRAAIKKALKDIAKEARKTANKIEKLRTPVRDMLRQLDDHYKQIGNRYENGVMVFENAPPEKVEGHPMFCMRNEHPARTIPQDLPCMLAIPANQVVLAEPKITEVDRIIPAQLVSPLEELQKGRRGIKLVNGVYIAPHKPKAPSRHTTPQNAGERLREVLWHVMWGSSPLRA